MTAFKTYIGAILIPIVALLCASCEKNEDNGTSSDKNVLMLMNVRESEAAEHESHIYSLRVWAFVGNKLAGYYEDFGDNSAPYDFLVDLKVYQEGTQRVDFYVIANEKAMGVLSSSLSKEMTRAQLDGLYFLRNNDFASNGIPMFYKNYADIDMTSIKNISLQPGDTDAVNENEHYGHLLINQKVQIELARCVSKLNLYAAKAQGETGTLKIAGARILQSGTKLRQYVMPQTAEILGSVKPTNNDIALTLTAEAENIQEYAGTLPEHRTEADYYTAVTMPYYIFENIYGSDTWEESGDENGTTLEIAFNFNGGGTVWREIHLPEIERNTIYNVLCLINNEGKIVINYEVADWSEIKWDMEFDFPTYSNPAKPYPSDDAAVVPYPQPTVRYDPVDPASGAFAVEFSMTAPTGQKFIPTLDRAATAYTLKVFQNGAEITDSQQWIASPDPYIIRVYAERADYVGEKCRLSISYYPMWLPEAQYLLINGRAGGLAYTGSTTPEHIDILQVE